jgi:glycosyl transferase family 7 (putative galactosyltransferase)
MPSPSDVSADQSPVPKIKEPAKLAVLVPTYFADTPEGAHRRRVWKYIRNKHWANARSVVWCGVWCGTDGLAECGRRPFSVSRAVNNAATWAQHSDITGYLIMGADHIPDPAALEYAARTLEQWPWVKLYSRIAYVPQEWTRALIDGYPYDELPQLSVINAPCPGVVAVRRDVWERVGGMNEDYEGYGYEDNQLCADLTRVAGPPGPVSPYTLRELWHPTGHRVHGDANPNHRLFRTLNEGV